MMTNILSDVDLKDLQHQKKKNRGQFQEGSERARMLGRLGGQRSSKKSKMRASSVRIGED